MSKKGPHSPVLSACALASSLVERDRAIGYFQAERRPDGSVHQDDLTPMGTYELRCDREAKPGATGPGRSLERLEQMGSRLVRKPRTGIRDFDDHNGPLASSADPNLIPCGIIGGAALQRLHGVAGEIEKNAQQLISISVDDQAAFDRRNPTDP